MKTIIQLNETSWIRRVSDDKAQDLVKSGEWAYISKEKWKAEVRDVDKKTKESDKKPKKKGKKDE
jgi:hypothetical protein